MGRLAEGDREALTPLMERHSPRIYRIALCYLRNPDEAMDAVQETFVKAFQHAGRWDRSSEVGPWLTRIAVNHSIDLYRRSRRRLQSEEPLAEGDHDQRVSSEGPSPERRMIGQQIGDRIGAALRALPEKQRAVFVLRHYEEMSLDEIAQAMDLSLGTVKSSLHRAIHGLRVRLAGLRA